MLRIQPSLAVFRNNLLRGTQSHAPVIRSIRLARPQPALHQQRLLQTLRRSETRSTASTAQWRTSALRRARNFRWNSNKSIPSATQEVGSQAPSSISGRFRELSRKYGWAAVGVYLGLSVLDFPFCFLAVQLVGPERIGEVEHAIVDGFWSLVGNIVPSMRPEERAKTGMTAIAGAEDTPLGDVHEHKDNASKCRHQTSKVTQLIPHNRHMDAAAACLRSAQVLDILSGTPYCGGDTEDC